MEPQVHSIYHLVKSEDLNHHGTLYAGRTAEWFVDAGFIAAALLAKPENIVCLKIHGMSFTAPVKKGEIVKFDSKLSTPEKPAWWLISPSTIRREPS